MPAETWKWFSVHQSLSFFLIFPHESVKTAIKVSDIPIHNRKTQRDTHYAIANVIMTTL